MCRNCGRVGHTLFGCPLSFVEAKCYIKEHIGYEKLLVQIGYHVACHMVPSTNHKHYGLSCCLLITQHKNVASTHSTNERRERYHMASILSAPKNFSYSGGEEKFRCCSSYARRSSHVYTSRIIANVHHPERRTTSIFPDTVQQSIPESVEGHVEGSDVAMSSTNVDNFVEDWDRHCDHGLWNFQSKLEKEMNNVQLVDSIHDKASIRDGLQVALIASVDHQAGPSTIHESSENRVLSSLAQEPVGSVGEFDLLWQKWKGELNAMGRALRRIICDAPTA